MKYQKSFKITDDEYLYFISENNISIPDSYRITKKSDMKTAIKQIRETLDTMNDIQFKRSDKEWIQEWRAHNFLYEAGLFKSQTASVDLDENETKERKRIYQILSFLYILIHK